MKGIILAAGSGTRLGSITRGIGETGLGISKPLAPTFDKPTIYYPLSDLISAGIHEILIIASPSNVHQYKDLIGDGQSLGVTISYAVQEVPRGIAEAFIIAERVGFICDESVALTFGDNVFSGSSFTKAIRNSPAPHGATVFAYEVDDPHRFGVVSFNSHGRAITIEEKPDNPKSNYAVVGIYFYDRSVVEVAKKIKPSDRGELEITDVNEYYLNRGLLDVVTLSADVRWFDTGTAESLFEAGAHIREEQNRTGRLIGSPEYAAYESGFIDSRQLLSHAERLKKSDYGQKLGRMVSMVKQMR